METEFLYLEKLTTLEGKDQLSTKRESKKKEIFHSRESKLISVKIIYSNPDSSYLKKMDDDVLLTMIKKELEKNEVERKKL